jgi:hypothetical protein
MSFVPFFMIPFRTLQPEGETDTGRAAAACFGGKSPKIPPILGFLGGIFEGEAQNPKNFFGIAPQKRLF